VFYGWIRQDGFGFLVGYIAGLLLVVAVAPELLGVLAMFGWLPG